MAGEILRGILGWMLGMAGIVVALSALWILVFGKEKRHDER